MHTHLNTELMKRLKKTAFNLDPWNNLSFFFSLTGLSVKFSLLYFLTQILNDLRVCP